VRGLQVTATAIILDAGVQWYHAYNAAHAKNRTVVGGYAVSVGSSGGWIMGGGHSALSSKYGLGTYPAIRVEP
jgi:FAD/FMN-containing dehydrogenase